MLDPQFSLLNKIFHILIDLKENNLGVIYKIIKILNSDKKMDLGSIISSEYDAVSEQSPVLSNKSKLEQHPKLKEKLLLSKKRGIDTQAKKIQHAKTYAMSDLTSLTSSEDFKYPHVMSNAKNFPDSQQANIKIVSPGNSLIKMGMNLGNINIQNIQNFSPYKINRDIIPQVNKPIQQFKEKLLSSKEYNYNIKDEEKAKSPLAFDFSCIINDNYDGSSCKSRNVFFPQKIEMDNRSFLEKSVNLSIGKSTNRRNNYLDEKEKAFNKNQNNFTFPTVISPISNKMFKDPKNKSRFNETLLNNFNNIPDPITIQPFLTNCKKK